jgi:hypothetical protein
MLTTISGWCDFNKAVHPSSCIPGVLGQFQFILLACSHCSTFIAWEALEDVLMDFSITYWWCIVRKVMHASSW